MASKDRWIIPLSPVWFALDCIRHRRTSDKSKTRAVARLCRKLDGYILERLARVYTDLPASAGVLIHKAIAECRIPSLVEHLEFHLFNWKGRTELRTAVVAALVNIRTREAIQRLVSLLSDEEESNRQAGVSALEGINWHPETSEERIDFAIARRKWHEVAIEGEAAVRPLSTAVGFRHNRPMQDRVSALECLYEIGTSVALVPLVSSMCSHEQEVRDAAVKAVKTLGHPETVSVVDNVIKHGEKTNVLTLLGGELAHIAIQDDNVNIQTFGAVAIGSLRYAEAVGDLFKMLDRDEEYWSRDAAINALVSIGGATVEGAFHKRLLDDNVQTRERSADALRQLAWEPPDGYSAAMLALAMSQFDDAFSELADDAAIWEERIRRALLHGDDGLAAIQLTVETLDRQDYYTAKLIIPVIAKLGGRNAIPVLVPLLRCYAYVHDDFFEISIMAQAALKMLGWSPDDASKAIIALQRHTYDEIQGLGQAAVEPMIHAIENKWIDNTRHCGGDVVGPASNILRDILKTSASGVAVADLQRISNLDDVELHYVGSGCYESASKDSWTVECADLRQLARQELIRREGHE